MTDVAKIAKAPASRRNFLKAAGGIAVFGGAFILVGCGDDSTSPTVAPTKAGAATASLYTRLGEEKSIQAVVDEFLVNVGGDTRINKFFANVDLKRLNMLLVQQISSAAGGPQKYTGRDMKTTHSGLKITKPDFDALVEDLVKALDKFKVPAQEKNELLTVLGGLQKDIVTA